MRHILFDILIAVVISITIWYVYTTYHEVVYNFIFGDQEFTVYIDDLAIRVSVADEQSERSAGLSGVSELGEFEGKLFIFPQAGFYSMWMKDMLMPLDVLWINDQFKVVHIEEHLQPESYPKSFVSDQPARFVLEVSSYFVATHKIQVGDSVTLPPAIIPPDILPPQETTPM